MPLPRSVIVRGDRDSYDFAGNRGSYGECRIDITVRWSKAPSYIQRSMTSETVPVLLNCHDRPSAKLANSTARWVSSFDDGAVNVATSRPVTVREMAEAVGDLIGCPELVELGALPDRPDDPAFLVADVETLVRNIGFRPRIALRQGLSDAVTYWRAGDGAVEHDR